MKLRSMFVVACVVLALSACKEVQLNGPVGGAEVSLSPLRTPNAVSWIGVSSSKSEVIRERGQKAWDESSEVAKSIWLGNVEVDTSSAYPGNLYLLTAKYGRDMDANADRIIETYGLAVSGEWHAIMNTEQLEGMALKVTVLTEAAYQYVNPYLQTYSDAQIQTKLDEFSRNVVTDIDRNGVVNYLDVLWWSRTIGDGGYKGSLNWLDQLADGIIRGVDRAEIARLSAQVYDNRATAPEPEPTGTTITGIVRDTDWTLAGSPYVITGPVDIENHLTIHPGVVVESSNSGYTHIYNGISIVGTASQNVVLGNNVRFSTSFPSNNPSNIVIKHTLFNGARIISSERQATLIVEDSTFNCGAIIYEARENAGGVLIQRNIFTGSRVHLNSQLPQPVDDLSVQVINNRFQRNDSCGSGSAGRSYIEYDYEDTDSLHQATIRYNSFLNDSGIDFYDYSTGPLDATHNYWGTTSSSAIESRLYDGNDTLKYPEVINFIPLLESPATATP